MRCIHCAEEIKFIADICPHCHRDTLDSRKLELKTLGLAFVSMTIGLVAGIIIGSFWWGIGIFFGVAIVGASLIDQKSDPKNVPVVRLEPTNPLTEYEQQTPTHRYNTVTGELTTFGKSQL